MSCVENMVADAEGAEKMSKRAERAKVAKRLRKLALGRSGHGNLSAICSAIYEPDRGWTYSASVGLCYKLAWLLDDGDL